MDKKNLNETCDSIGKDKVDKLMALIVKLTARVEELENENTSISMRLDIIDDYLESL
jgi:hypothetical protein